MSILLALALAMALHTARQARAGEQPLYQPAPDWVKRAPELDKEPPGADAPQLLIFDAQSKLEKGQVWQYSEVATRIASADALGKAGNFVLNWSPEHGDLIVHSVDIIRGAERISALANGAHFTTLRREANLEQRMLNGVLSATLAIEGLRIGDVIDVRYSITRRDPVLKDHESAAVPILPSPVPVWFGRTRARWPTAERLAWKTFLEGAAPQVTADGAWTEVSLKLPAPRQPDPAPNAPGRFTHPWILDVSNYADWAAVSATMAPLYGTENSIRPGGELDGEVRRIAADSADTRRRIALALRLVQDKVRYFAVALNGGNLIPQTPEETWTRRYGDCKAKTLLLLAILHRLGVQAEPALASLGAGDLVRERLPSVEPFNHIFVLARDRGQTLWLDGTTLGAREADLEDVPPYHWVLPVRQTGAALLAAPPKAPARPLVEYHLTEDERGGIGVQGSVEGVVSVRGPAAGALKSMVAGLDKETRTKFLTTYVFPWAKSAVLAPPTFAYDDAANVATITFRGISRTLWTRADGRFAYDTGPTNKETPPDRSRSIWKAIPVDAGAANHLLGEETVLLPRGGAGIVVDGQADLTIAFPGNQVRTQHVELKAGVLSIRREILLGGGEYDPAELPDMRRKLSEIRARAPKLRTVPDYAPPWTDVEAARRAHVFDPAIAVLNAAVAEKPDDPQHYMARANYHYALFDYENALADYTRLIELRPDKTAYGNRATIRRKLGDDAKAIEDLKAAYDLDPSDLTILDRLTKLQALSGASAAALEELSAALENGGDNAPFIMAARATALSLGGQPGPAMTEINAALDKRPGNAQLLNARCWLRATLNRELEAAMADCTQAIHMNEAVSAAALDSRALVYFRQNQLQAALTDVNAALALRPRSEGSLFLRALLERASGLSAKAAEDIAAVRLLDRSVEREYARYGLRWTP